MKEKNRIVSPLTVILGILLVVAVLIIVKLSSTPQEEVLPIVIGGGEPIPETEDVVKDDNVIHLPAYDSLTFTAGTKEQNDVLQNPSENTCLIRISLVLADGTTIYTSELVEPGYYTMPITLVAPMERGLYRNVTMKYECFTNDENRSPLNGATTKLDITVE